MIFEVNTQGDVALVIKDSIGGRPPEVGCYFWHLPSMVPVENADDTHGLPLLPEKPDPAPVMARIDREIRFDGEKFYLPNIYIPGWGNCKEGLEAFFSTPSGRLRRVVIQKWTTTFLAYKDVGQETLAQFPQWLQSLAMVASSHRNRYEAEQRKVRRYYSSHEHG